jgi:hypothetical protein
LTEETRLKEAESALDETLKFYFNESEAVKQLRKLLWDTNLEANKVLYRPAYFYHLERLERLKVELDENFSKISSIKRQVNRF